MSPLKWLNRLLILENVLGVYRNYSRQKKIKKCCIVFHILVQTLLSITIVIGQLYLLLIDDVYSQINYIYCEFVLSSFSTGLSSVVGGIRSSSAFTSYIESISRVSKLFEDDKKYIKSLKTLRWFGLTFILLSFTFTVFRTLDLVINFKSKDHKAYLILRVPTVLSQGLLRFTTLYEKLMIFVVIMIVVNLSKCLYSLISALQERLGICDINSDEQCDITREQIYEWIELYRDLANCCQKITLCFGDQFILSLVMSVSYYILLTYQMCYLSVLNREDKKITIVIISYALLTMFPIIAGQMAYNQGLKLHRLLARLYCTMAVFDSHKAEAKLVKDFIRFIKKNPLEIKLLSNFTAGMYILPVILMLTVNYIIVMLQFNNIV